MMEMLEGICLKLKGTTQDIKWEHYLVQSYRLVLGRLSKKVQKEILGEAPDFS